MLLPMATDWATISSLATAGGTLVLAVATFASVRSANRSARVAEVALQEQRRPVLVPSRFDDPVQKIMYVEQHWVRAGGGRGVAEHTDGNVYLAISLRNVGSGIGVCQGWAVTADLLSSRTMPDHQPESDFRIQTRDLWIPPSDVGMWQGALRDRQDPVCPVIAQAIDDRQPLTVELLYSDQVGEQRTITRFGLTPFGEDDWVATAARHWFLDRAGPRPEAEAQVQAERIMRNVEVARAEAEEAASQAEAAQAEAEAAAEAAEESADGGEAARSETTPAPRQRVTD